MSAVDSETVGRRWKLVKKLLGRCQLAMNSSFERSERANVLDRLQSFTLPLWFGKPASLSPVACAMRGWRCIAKDTLRCQGCNHQIVMRVSDRLDDPSKDRMFESFTAKLDNFHNSFCPFLGRALAFCQILPTDEDSLTQEAAVRMATFTQWSSPVAEFSRFTLPEHNSNLPLTEVLSICGWERARERVLSCSTCGRVVDLRVCTKKRIRCEGEVGASISHEKRKRPRPGAVFQIGCNVQPCVKFGIGRDMFGRVNIAAVAIAEKNGLIDKAMASELLEGKVFDAIEEHRFFCPWISSELPNSKPGWILCLDAWNRRLESSQEESDDKKFEDEAERTMSCDEFGKRTVLSVRRLLSSVSK